MKNSKILIFGTILILIVFVIGSLIAPDKTFSENENRVLQDKPEFTFNSVLSGRFETQMENYLNDHILFRDGLVQTMSFIRHYAYGNRDINGAYIGDGGRLYKKVTNYDFDWEGFKNNLEEVKTFSVGLNVPVKTMLVPTASFIEMDGLPMHANTFDEDKAFDTAREILGEDLIQIKDIFLAYRTVNPGDIHLYYYTDHHWTNEAAYVSYKAYRDDWENLNYENIEKVVLTDEFLGSLYSKALLSDKKKDIIEVPEYLVKEKYNVSIDGKEYDSILFMDRLKNKDKYEVFLGGNYDRVDIQGKGNKNILIVKDSYANSFVPYLLNDYGMVTLIDTRYYRDNIKDLAENGEYDEILILYSIDNFAEQKIHLSKKLLS